MDEGKGLVLGSIGRAEVMDVGVVKGERRRTETEHERAKEGRGGWCVLGRRTVGSEADKESEQLDEEVGFKMRWRVCRGESTRLTGCKRQTITHRLQTRERYCSVPKIKTLTRLHQRRIRKTISHCSSQIPAERPQHMQTSVLLVVSHGLLGLV
jgi:hypothetical protein